MEFRQLPGVELVELPDEDLGQWLVTSWLYFQASKDGIAPNVTLGEWATQVLEKTGRMDSDSVANAALESMFRKAVKGDVASAGRMFRTYLHSLAQAKVRDKYAAVGIKQTVDRKKGGKKTAQAMRDAAAPWHAACVKKARTLLVQDRSSRELAGILARQFNVTPQTINAVLKKAKVK